MKTRKEVRTVLSAIATGELDPYEGYTRLNVLWMSRNSAAQELRPLFRIPGIDPNGTFSVTDAFRDQVVNLAKEILTAFPD